MHVPLVRENGVRTRRREAPQYAPKREPGAADAVLALQRSVGNRAVSGLVRGRSGSARVLQREIVIENIDYNPEEQQARDGIVDHAAFFDGLTSALRKDDKFAAYRGQLSNVVGALRDRRFAKPDINELTQEITAAVVAEYGTRGLQMPGLRRSELERYIRDGLVANIRRDHTMRMEKAEEEGFDTLKAIAGGLPPRTPNGPPALSRGKGNPSRVTFDRLPGQLQTAVGEFITRLNAENQSWTLANLEIEFTLPDEPVEGPVINRLKKDGRYQGNHSNMAKWLPDVAAPMDTLDYFRTQAYATVYEKAGPNLKRGLYDTKPRNRLGLNDAARPYRNDAREE